MEGISLVETKTLEALISEVQGLKQFVTELADNKKPYLTATEATEMIGFSRDWITDKKYDIGYTIIGGCLIFKRKDVEAYMEQNYFKTKSPRRKTNDHHTRNYH